MKQRRGLLAVAGPLGLIAAASLAPTVHADEPGTSAQQLPELVLTQVAVADVPTAGTVGPGDSIWITEREGRVRILGDQGLGEPVLDISDEVSVEGEGGLLGLAFDPDFTHFYVSFTGLDGGTNIDEFAVADGQLQLDTRRSVFTHEQPFSNHNGGNILFGPDGMMYIGLGDGGGSGDPSGNGQNLETYLGKILRIDPSGAVPYAVPPDNPFVGDPDALDEIWAYGLRNPWRYSFDAATGELWIADVGQNLIEEVNLAPAGVGGQNYGWSLMEGTLPFNGTEPANHTPPIFEYDNDGARCAVTGGYVYRGQAIPDLQGAYLFSDYCEGDIRALELQDGEVVESNLIDIPSGGTFSFFEDADNEVYVLDGRFGNISRIDPAEPPEPADDCTAAIAVVNDWGTGWQGAVEVTAAEEPLTGWTLQWTWPGGQTVTGHWNADLTVDGADVTAADVGWNGAVASGSTLQAFGFIATGPAAAPEITCTAL